MAKTKKPTIDADTVERAVRKAIDEIPGIRDMDEPAYCEAVLSGLDLIKTGVEMRQQELNEEGD